MLRRTASSRRLAQPAYKHPWLRASCATIARMCWYPPPLIISSIWNTSWKSVLTSTLSQLRGAALALGDTAGRPGTAPDDIGVRAGDAGYTLVEVFPFRMHLEPARRRRYRETIDFVVRRAELPLTRVPS